MHLFLCMNKIALTIHIHTTVYILHTDFLFISKTVLIMYGCKSYNVDDRVKCSNILYMHMLALVLILYSIAIQ